MTFRRRIRHCFSEAAQRTGAVSAFRSSACALDRALYLLRHGGWPLRGGLVFLFHRVVREVDPFRSDCLEQQFDRFCQHLAEHYEVLPLHELERRRTTGADLTRCVAITFDDGYADNYWVAFPVLKRYGLPATLFVTTRPIDGGPPIWTSRAVWIIEHGRCRQPTPTIAGFRLQLQTREHRARTALDLVERLRVCEHAKRNALLDQLADELQVTDFSALRSDMLTWDQLREMDRGGFSAQPHTLTHPILSLLAADEIERELAEAKEELEGEMGRPADLFAYPRGMSDDFDQRSVDAVRRIGYRAAYTARFAPVRPGDDAYRLPRVCLYAQTAGHMAIQIERFFYLR